MGAVCQLKARVARVVVRALPAGAMLRLRAEVAAHAVLLERATVAVYTAARAGGVGAVVRGARLGGDCRPRGQCGADVAAAAARPREVILAEAIPGAAGQSDP